MDTSLLQGAFSAIPTPLLNGKIDEETFRAQIEWQIEQGIDGFVPCSTTGESATLTHAEHQEVMKICIDQVKGRVPVFAGTGSNSTDEAVSLTKFAKQVGADGAVIITPYYNRPTPDGLYAHYKRIAEEASLPIILYNVPSRTGCNMQPETVARIVRDIPEVVAIKEASGSLTQASRIIEECPDGFQLLSGEDDLVLPLMSVGGCGVISVTSNIVPGMMSGLCKAYLAGDVAEARRLHFAMQPLVRSMFIETNPLPVKTAQWLMGQCKALEFRMPLVPMREENVEALKKVLSDFNLIK